MDIQHWTQIEAGSYIATHPETGAVFTIEYDLENKGWICRRDGIMFDKAITLREAKSYCVEPK